MTEVWHCVGCGRTGTSTFDVLRQGCEGRPERFVRALPVWTAMWYLDGGDGGRDAQAASVWLRTTLPEEHPNYLTSHQATQILDRIRENRARREEAQECPECAGSGEGRVVTDGPNEANLICPTCGGTGRDA